MRMFSLSQREKGNKKYWYVQFKDDDTGKYGTAKSIDTLSRKLGDNPHHITKKPEAYSVALRASEKGLDGNDKTSDILFLDYLAQFWDYDNSFYVKRENAKRANSINRDYVYNMAGCIKNHVVPVLSSFKGLKCSQVKSKHIEKIQERAVARSVNIWHSVLRSISVPIRELLKKKVLPVDPLENLETYSVENKSSVGSLTARETDKLIKQMYEDATTGYTISVRQIGPKKTIVNVDIPVLLDKRVYLAVCLSASTGMRKGEILGLHITDIHYPNAEDNAEEMALIDIRNSYARHQGMKSPKSKRDRTVFVPKWLADELVEFAMTNPHENGLVFYSDKMNDRPIDSKVFSVWFNRELTRIGIDENERRERHLVFHSLRHYANSEMRTKIGDERTQLIMGHTSTAMTDRYDTEDKAQRVYQIGREVGSIIINPNNDKNSQSESSDHLA